ncbi:MAG: biotin/lipoyl-containing protein, partial [Gemmatimonadaceae bacterium]
MARIDVSMPQMGESIAEGTLSRWLKKVGDEVRRDEPIFEISTDKVDAEIPAPAAGVIVEILIQEGETVPVQTIVARMETEKGAAAAVVAAPAAPVAAATPVAASATQSAAAPTAPTPAAPAPRDDGGPDSLETRLRTKSSPLVRKMAAEHGIDITSLQGSGLAGRVTRKDLMEVLESGVPARTEPS